MPTDEQQIRNVVANWMTATKRGDIDAVLELMADDVVFLRPGAPPMVGKAAFAAAAAPQTQQQAPQFDGKSDIQEVKVCGDWAFMWSKLDLTIQPPGGAPAMKRSGHTLSVFHKENGKWVLARDANLLGPPETANG